MPLLQFNTVTPSRNTPDVGSIAVTGLTRGTNGFLIAALSQLSTGGGGTADFLQALVPC